MATRAENLDTVRRIRTELMRLLDGMDYCLDWKDGNGWCAREILYHLADTPDGGVGGVIAGTLDGSRAEVTIRPDINNITAARRAADIDAVIAGPLSILQTAEDAISAAADADFEQRTIFVRLPARGIAETRAAQSLIDGVFARHWGEHLAQLRTLRETLGI